MVCVTQHEGASTLLACVSIIQREASMSANAYRKYGPLECVSVTLATSTHRLTLGASAGACFDAVLLLPQKPAVDRAAMNLLQNWNYSPWHNPL